MMRTHERGQFCSVMVGRHKQIALVLVGWIAGRLSSGRQTLEVELVGVPLAVHLGHNVLVVIVPIREDGLLFQNVFYTCESHSSKSL